MNRIIAITISLIYVLVSVSCSFWQQALTPNLLAEKLRLQMKQEKFEQMYDESDDFVRRNVTKEDFIASMRKIVREVKEIDENIDWRENFDLGKSTGFNRNTKSNFYYAFKELEQETNKITLLIYWSDESGSPKLFGLSAFSYRNGEQYFQIDAMRGVLYHK